MINDIVFLVVLALLASGYLYWGFTRLTADNRQIFAAMPDFGLGNDAFRGINFTWYGLLSANGVAAGVLLYVILSSAMGIPVGANLILVGFLLAILLPSARLIARIVEKKKHTFTIGGSVFAGIVLTPWVLLLWNHTLGSVTGAVFPLIETLACLVIAYSLGESFGRLSCISFGCCYGKPLSDCHPLLQRLFENRAFVYSGNTRKACYASDLEGVKLMPIQAVTAVIYALAALAGLLLLMTGHAGAALILTMAVTQIWRSISEIFRADYRGEGNISAYQLMGLVATGYILIITALFSSPSVMGIHPAYGLAAVWTPGVILALQALWLIVFVYMGKSTVTHSTLHVHVFEGRV